MKKILYIFLTLVLIMPINLQAATYKAKDMSLNFDEDIWTVFTRDNIKGNESLSEFGVDEDYMDNLMKSNDIYIDAVKLEENQNETMEAFIIIKELDNTVNNLYTYSDKDIEELGKAVADKIGVKSYDVVTVDKFKFIHTISSDQGYYIEDYYTVMNGYGYTFKVQRNEELTNVQKEDIKKLLNTVTFSIDKKYEKKSTSSSIGNRALSGAITAIIIAGLGLIFRKKKTEDGM